MPKTYTDKEKEAIKKQLIQAANDCLALYGVKKTTVDELVKRVNIPKGTFYLFYESKERLLFEAINELHDNIRNEFLQEASLLKEDITKEKLTELLLRVFKKVDETYLLRIMTNGDMELLMRKLPDEVVAKHMEEDDISMEQLLSVLPGMKNKNVEAFSAAFRGVFLTLLFRREIGESIYEEALRLMIHGLILQIMEVDYGR